MPFRGSLVCFFFASSSCSRVLNPRDKSCNNKSEILKNRHTAEVNVSTFFSRPLVSAANSSRFVTQNMIQTFHFRVFFVRDSLRQLLKRRRRRVLRHQAWPIPDAFATVALANRKFTIPRSFLRPQGIFTLNWWEKGEKWVDLGRKVSREWRNQNVKN